MKRYAEGGIYEIYQGCSPCTISGNIHKPSAVILASSCLDAGPLLVNTKNRNLWEGPTQEVRDSLLDRVSMLRVVSDKSDWLRIRKYSHAQNFGLYPRVAILGADLKEHGVWGGECLDRMKFRQSLFARLIRARVTVTLSSL